MVCQRLQRVIFLLVSTALILMQLPSDVSCQSSPIFNVKSFCASDRSGQTRILVISDIPDFSVVATCAGGFKYNFTAVDAPSKEIYMSYTGDPSLACVFNEKVSSATYTAEVNVGLTSSGPLRQDQFYLITCTYDPYIQGQSGSNMFYDTMYPHEGIYKHMGPNSTSQFKLSIVNIFNRPIKGSISTKQYIKLKIQLTAPAPGVISFQVLNCDARNGLYSYGVLIAGCGDGKLILSHRGFNTLGKFAYSDAFRSFHMFGGNRIYFTCILVTCTNNCDGPSCLKRRKRNALHGRGVQNTGKVVAVVSRLDIASSTAYTVVGARTKRSPRAKRNDDSYYYHNGDYRRDDSANTSMNVKPLIQHTKHIPTTNSENDTKVDKQKYLNPTTLKPPRDGDTDKFTVTPIPVTVYTASVLAVVFTLVGLACYKARYKSGLKIQRSLTTTRPYSVKF